jgi:Holliday junction resolvasome RuvABC DNA-binding subunit
LHFRDIAKKIDEYHLNKKKTHFQTVHNELIKDNNFVLVGRGIYALVEWGYKKGTVKDVIENILKQSQELLSREVILEKVLEVRKVKSSTIIINLNNYFSKSKDGKYMINKS